MLPLISYCITWIYKQNPKVFCMIICCHSCEVFSFSPWKWYNVTLVEDITSFLNINLKLTLQMTEISTASWNLKLNYLIQSCVILQIVRQLVHQVCYTSSIKKLPISKVESLLKSNFDLNQVWKVLLTQSH